MYLTNVLMLDLPKYSQFSWQKLLFIILARLAQVYRLDGQFATRRQRDSLVNSRIVTCTYQVEDLESLQDIGILESLQSILGNRPHKTRLFVRLWRATLLVASVMRSLAMSNSVAMELLRRLLHQQRQRKLCPRRQA